MTDFLGRKKVGTKQLPSHKESSKSYFGSNTAETSYGPEKNMELENHPIDEEIHLPNLHVGSINIPVCIVPFPRMLFRHHQEDFMKHVFPCHPAKSGH